MDMGKSSETETSGGASSVIDYEVFLSFRGPDTRQGFTDCLYHDLLEANIRVFFDEEELHVGKEIADELPTAIEKSKIYVPVFSKGYASSAWCLRELAHMVECKNSKPSEKEIMPIFYDVEPGDVKLKSQVYIGALEEHEKKFGRQMRLKWEDALKSVPKMKGWELKEQGHWKFIKSVIQEILMKLKIKDKLVTEHLVGMDNRAEAVVRLLDLNSEDMRFVLIHGMGGIGKTTLAKVVFNKMNSLFSHCCFLGNVRESPLGLINLQNQLLSNMFGSGYRDHINDVDDGIKMIAKRLSNKKVFIVLDDVDDEELLEKLAIKRVSFGSGSRIIITTRNKNVLKAYQTLEYEVKPLDSVQSLELFTRHAFGRNIPSNDYVSLSKQIVSTTGGLPLALEVIGSLLRRQDKASWIDVLENLREIPHERVQDKLKISYNALSREQKQIFLDIACLFMDDGKTNAFYMWKDCRFGPDYSTQVLVCMSLIKITDDNKFWMHDQLRDLGRTIVRGDTMLMDPRKQSRLWVPATALNIIRTEERKEAIEAICLDGLASGIYTSEEFSRLPNIRFLKLARGHIAGDFKNQLSELRYMSWHRCPQALRAVNFHPSNVVVLNLSHSSITENWAGWNQIKVAKKLKVLDLTNCNNMTRTPNFSEYLSLERLIIKNCKRVIEVDDSLEKLKCLVYFNADGCTSLVELSEGFGGLEKLKYLYLGSCPNLSKLPESFAGVTSLVELDLSFTAITTLPDYVGNQKHLELLKLRSTKIDELPSSIGNLWELKFLFLSHTKIRELPVSIGNLESLLELDVSGTNCRWLPESIGNLSRLKVLNFSNSWIRELPWSIAVLKELEELHGGDCVSLKREIPEGIRELPLLRVLDLHVTSIRNVPVEINLLSRLEKLNLWHCSELAALPELPTSLISLSFGSRWLQRVPDLSCLTKLVDLSYGGHDENYHPLFFQDVPCRQSLMFLPSSLSTLSLEYHRSLTSLSFHCNLRNLTCLRIFQCRWKKIQLDGLEQLIEFEVAGLEFLEGFAGLSRLKRLKVWTLTECPKLTAIQGLGYMESLEQLQIKECPKIESLDDLSNLEKLESLFIRRCDELRAVKGLDELKTLKRLDIMHCRSIETFTNISNLKIPDECCININGCSTLKDWVLECTKSRPSKKLKITPIFYELEPHDFKLKSQLYINALAKHDEKFDHQTIEAPKDAAKMVTLLNGWELKDQRWWEPDKSLIQEVLINLKTKDKYVAKHSVGMDNQVEAVLKLLDVGSGGMRFVLIHGMGGIGKTTLAKVVFNRLRSLFSRSCFLENVRESSSVSFGLLNLQKQLLSNTLGLAFQDKIHDIDDGIKAIAQRLSDKKLFIVLDDVYCEEQLEKLAIKHISFGSGSRVILTSRNKSIIEADKTLEYQMKQLDFGRSLALFNRHAFGRNPPPYDYVNLSRELVCTTGGLPLTLEVVSSLLHSKSKAVWIDVLEKLREIPNERVEEKLKISYDALSDEQKQIFLDIACLFVDRNKEKAFYMWKDCRFGPDYSAEVLVRMSLIKITGDNKFWMHDQLRDLGRKIVCEDARMTDPSKQSRLWVPEMASNIIRTEERKEAIEAICLDGKASGIFTSQEISRLPNIRFLKLTGGHLVGDFKKQLSRLRYMSWYGCPQEFSATNFHPSNLVVLELPHSSIREDWAGWSQIKVAKMLKFLDLKDCIHITRTPDFSHYTSLERLALEDCISLIEVDSSLEKLECLIYFGAQGCENLTELPEGIGRLKKLKYLYLGNCKKLTKLPGLCAGAASLVKLDLSNTAITRLPDSIGNQKHLSVLNLRGTKINELPSSIGNLGELQYLILSGTKIEELPISIGNLKSLLELDVSNTQCLQLPESVGDLSRLKVIKISRSLIRELPQSIVKLKELEKIHAKSCRELKWEVPVGICKLSLLRVLDLEFTPIRNLPRTIRLLRRLVKLGLCGCSGLEPLPELPTSLIRLSLKSSLLRCIPDLSKLTRLVNLRYRGDYENCCPLFPRDGPCQQSIEFLPPSVSELSLEYHESMTSLSFHCNLQNLGHLHINKCCWKEVQFDGLEQLIEFIGEKLEFLEGFAGLSSAKRLKQFRLLGCPNVTAIRGLGSLESLKHLDIVKCPKIESLDDLSDLKQLESLQIEECEELLAVKGLDELKALTKVGLTHCRSLRTLPNVLDWKAPDKCLLTILSCPNLEDNGITSEKFSMYKQRKVR